jgi:hypothetical protein
MTAGSRESRHSGAPLHMLALLLVALLLALTLLTLTVRPAW